MRTFAPTRISQSVSAAISVALYDATKAHADSHEQSMANTIRMALMHYDYSKPPAGVPAKYANYHRTPCRCVGLRVQPESLRREYEDYAKAHGMTMTQLISQACYDYVKPTTDSANSCPTQDESP